LKTPHPYNLLSQEPRPKQPKTENTRNYREGNQSLQAKYLFLETQKVRDQIHLEESLSSSYTCEKNIFKKKYIKEKKIVRLKNRVTICD
jgi:hypothetical protein